VGEYLCKFVLTEESFHQSGLGGGWASVLDVDVNYIAVIPDGDVNADGNVNAADILLAVQVALGSRNPTPEQLGHGDVAPLVDGVPDPDGLFDLRDVMVITSKAQGLISF